MLKHDQPKISLFSGKYDSVKQRMALLNGNRYLNFLRYTATLRLEMLLTETIYITDAQWCDGLYFSWLATADSEFSSFINVVMKNQLLKVFVRADSPKAVAGGMFNKPFLFSSIESNELEEQVFKYIEHPLVKEQLAKLKDDKASFENYFTAINNCIKLQASVFEKDFDSFTTRIVKLFNKLDSVYVESWDKDRYIFDCIWQEMRPENDKGNNSYLNYFKTELGRLGNDYLPGKPGSEMHDRLKNMVAKQLKDLEDNLLKESRSYLYKIIDDIENEVSSCLYFSTGDYTESYSKFRSKLNNLKALYNDRYNKTLAFQHKALLLDTYDNQQIIEDVNKQAVGIEKLNLTLASQRILAQMTWDEFAELLNDSNIYRYRNNWLNILRDPGSDAKNSKAADALREYLPKLENKLSRMKLSNSLLPDCLLQAINYQKTFDLNNISNMINENQNWFIGNSSNITGSETEEVLFGNEISVLVGNTIFRIKDQENGTDADFDTIIAPLDNCFNNDLQSIQKVKSDRIQVIAEKTMKRLLKLSKK